MSFDEKKLRAPAERGDVADVAIKTSIALDHVIKALQGLAEGKDIAKVIAEIQKRSDELDRLFDELTGYKS